MRDRLLYFVSLQIPAQAVRHEPPTLRVDAALRVNDHTLNGVQGRWTFHEFFCGGGMTRAGLGPSFRCGFANDIDRSKGASYVANFGTSELKVRAVARLTTADLLGHADLAWASFPCQDLNLAGDRAGLRAACSGTFWSFWRLMQALRAEGRAPRLIGIENVASLLTSHEGKDFDALVSALVEGGYRVGAVTIDAALWLPQSRERVFVVAVDAAVDVPDKIVAPGPETPFHPPMLVKACSRQAAPIWWRLPAPPSRNLALVDIVEDTPTGVHWNPGAATARLIGMMAPLHLAKLEEAKRAGKRRVGAIFRRMRDEAGGRVQRDEIRFDIAGCLRVPSGGSSRQTVMIVDGGDTVQSRLMSPRECARLMGLDDSYILPADLNEALGLMGDGVAVPAVHHLADTSSNRCWPRSARSRQKWRQRDERGRSRPRCDRARWSAVAPRWAGEAGALGAASPRLPHLPRPAGRAPDRRRTREATRRLSIPADRRGVRRRPCRGSGAARARGRHQAHPALANRPLVAGERAF
jgi:DNA (cytosine-5)-methyltransferase 1